MVPLPDVSSFFFFNDTATTEIYTLSLHDALPISPPKREIAARSPCSTVPAPASKNIRSEEHTSELQSRLHLVCRLLLEKKKKGRRDALRQRGSNQHRERSDVEMLGSVSPRGQARR